MSPGLWVAAFSRAATSVETSSLTERCTTGVPRWLRLSNKRLYRRSASSRTCGHAQPCQSLVNFEQGVLMRCLWEPKSMTTATPSSTLVTVPRPYLSWVIRSFTA